VYSRRVSEHRIYNLWSPTDLWKHPLKLSYPKNSCSHRKTIILTTRKCHSQNRTILLTIRKCHSQNRTRILNAEMLFPKQNKCVLFWEWHFRIVSTIVLFWDSYFRVVSTIVLFWEQKFFRQSSYGVLILFLRWGQKVVGSR